MTEFGIPLDADTTAWAVNQLRSGVSARTIAHILQLSELTGESHQSIAARYNELRMELDRVFHIVQP